MKECISSDPNFQQSADCGKLESPEPKFFSCELSFQKNLEAFFFLLHRSSVFDFSELGSFADKRACQLYVDSDTTDTARQFHE